MVLHLKKKIKNVSVRCTCASLKQKGKEAVPLSIRPVRKTKKGRGFP